MNLLPSLTLLLPVVLCTNASSAVIYESATLGETGIPRLDVGTQVVPGSNINPYVFNGVRFELMQPAVTTAIGGHFVGPFSEEDTIFGALVRLTDETDFPDSADLSTPDVLGHTLLHLPLESADIYGDLQADLSPGWYALVFGSGLFGAEGRGAALSNNADLRMPNYISYQPSSFGWHDTSVFDVGYLPEDFFFAVQGTIVPEPSTLKLTAGFAAVILLATSARYSSRWKVLS